MSSRPIDAGLLAMSERDALANRTWIADLNNCIAKVTVVGIVITKQSPRTISPNTEKPDERCVLNFTLRDSQRDTVNAACWGDKDAVFQMGSGFRIGDCVQVNALVRNRNMGSNSERFSPDATSQFHLVINAGKEDSGVSIVADEAVFCEFLSLFQVPLKPMSEVTPIADLLYCGNDVNGQHVSLLVGVQKIGAVTHVSTKDGRQTQKLDVTVCDQSHFGFKLSLWDEELIKFSEVWKAGETVLYVADARVRLNNTFGMTASADGKTVITVNPDMLQATALFEYLQSVVLGDDGPEGQFVDMTVYTAKELNEEIQSRVQSGNLSPLTGFFYAFLNQFDLDGPGARLISSRCGHCNFRMKQGQACPNGTCPVATGQAEPATVDEIDIPVAWTDHTGTIIRSRLSGQVADNLLGVTVVEEFQMLSEDEMTSLKWNFLLERFKVQFQVSLLSSATGREPMVRVVNCERANPKEFLERVFARY
ncbi:unnamed protein product [Ixodes hexagonus]